jgi:hypothetical protein
MKERTGPRPLDVWTYNDFVDRFHGESDRAAAVLAGAYLDAFMESALRDVLARNSQTDVLFDVRGVLQSLSSKISLAAALGIVAEPVARDMDLIRKIRNYFAHHIWDATFETSPMSDWCGAIEIVDAALDHTSGDRVNYEGSPRSRYLLAVGISLMMVTHSPKVSGEFRERMTGIPGRR